MTDARSQRHPTQGASTGKRRGRLLVISGPSGAGKTTVARRLLADRRYARARTATTRPPRGSERQGVDYDFLTEDAFRKGLAEDAFVEHAVVYGRLYGTPRANLEQVLQAGHHGVLVVDVQGASTLRELGVDAYYVFVVAPSADELRRRLESRGQDDGAAIARRLAEAEEEMAQAKCFDLVLVNDDLEAAVRRLVDEAQLDWTPRTTEG